MNADPALDIAGFVALNNDAVPAVSPLTESSARQLLEVATHVVTRSEGLVVLLGPGADYASANYEWFSERFDEFLYVDRIIVGEEHRGSGVGEALYRDVFSFADAAGVDVLAEVNLTPPNPGSSRFHRRAGFEQVGTLEHSANYVVEMLRRSPSG